MEPGEARSFWHLLETINAVTYFAPECRAAMTEIGLKGFWMGYFASRSAPFGDASAGLVEATFFNFNPVMIRRSLPDAWSFAAPDVVVSTRSDSATTAIQRLAPSADELAVALLPILHRVVEHASASGRPLFAANRDLCGSTGVAGLWQCATTLREHRGDGHVATLTAEGVDGCEAHILFAATEGIDSRLLRDSRGWTESEWIESTQRLQSRGLLTAAATATPAARRLRRRIELRTDVLAAQPYSGLSISQLSNAAAALSILAGEIASTAVIPYPNPMGLPNTAVSPATPPTARY